MENNEVQSWIEEIESGIEYREKMAYEKRWEEIEDAYYCDPNSNAAVGPNLVFSEGDTLLSSLSVPDPEILLEPEDMASVKISPIVERLANKLVQPHRLNLKQHVELGGLNSYLASKLIIKLGYDSEFGWDPQFDLGKLSNPLGMTPTQFDKKGNRIERMNVAPGMPWAATVHPHDFVVPWGTGPDIENAPWVAHRIIRENEYFKKDPKYINTKNLKPQMSSMDFQNSYSFGVKNYRKSANLNRGSFASGRTKPELMYNEVWEIHDRMHNKILCVCFTHNKFIRNSNNALMTAIGGYPFITGGFIKSSRHFWTPPLGYYLLPHQAEIFDTYKQIAKQRRINVAKFLMLEGAMEDSEVTKLSSGDVGAFAKVKKSSGKRLQDVFMAFPKTASYDLMNDSELIRRNTRDIMGFSRNQMGEFDASSRRTAYEAHRVFQGSESRATSKEDVIKHVYTTTIKKVLKMVSKFWTMPRPILHNQEWYMFTGAQIAGNFSFDVRLNTKSNLSKAQRMQEAMMMLFQFAQIPNANLPEIEKHILNAANDPAFEGFFSGVSSMAPSSPLQASASNGSEQKPALGAGMSNNTNGGM